MAGVHGPLALFAVGQVPAKVRPSELSSVAQISSGSTEWQTKTASGVINLRPFTAIQDEHYRLYMEVEA